MAISSNSSSFTLKLQNFLGKASGDTLSSFTKLASGKRINSAADDAAGLAIVSALESDKRIFDTAVRNTNDGVSISNIIDNTLNSVQDITTRQQELATQAANGTYSDTQRQALDTEFQALEQEKTRILDSTEFNGTKLFDTSEITLQVGKTSDASSQIALPSISSSSLLTGGAVASVEQARNALDSLKNQSDSVTSLRSKVGATVSRLETAANNARVSSVESESAASRIRDVDVAEESAKLTSSKIRQQGGTALLAQANLNSARVLDLLK